MTPKEIIAGLNATWTVDTDVYPASEGWVIEFALVSATSQIVFSSATVNNDHVVSLSADATGSYEAGSYFYQAVAKKDSDVYLIETGDITVTARFSTLDALDARPHCKKVLDAIEAVLEGKANQDQLKYTIGSRSLERYSFDELIRLRQVYQVDWANWQKSERIRKGLGASGKIFVRF